MDIKEKIDRAPHRPGVYILKEKNGQAIYIGKATSLKKRLKSHFTRCKDSRQKALVENTSDMDYILTTDESTALLLEAALIKRYSPKYNIALRDDKSYPLLKLTANEEYPKLSISRKVKDDGALYFGPYTNAKLLRKAINFMKRIFPLRTCQRLAKKECLDFHIGQCLAPCVDKRRKEEYLKIVEELRLFLEGKQDELLNLFNDSMNVFVTDSKEGYKYSYYNKTYLETMDLIFSRIGTILKNETLIVSIIKEGGFRNLVDDEDVVITYTITEGSYVWDHKVIFYFWNNKITGVSIWMEGV